LYVALTFDAGADSTTFVSAPAYEQASMQGSKLALLLELGKHIYGSRSLSGTGGTGIDFTTVGSKARSAFG